MTDADWRALLAERDAEIAELKAIICDLQARLNADSTKSSRPPSSDGLKKPNPKSLRKPSGKKVGGQPGHPGTSLSRMEATSIIEHRPAPLCSACGEELPESHIVETRQVIDIPPISLEATDHHLFEAHCRCGHRAQGSWPISVESYVQYGSRLRALAVHLTQQHMLPFERCSSLMQDLFGASISVATLQRACIIAKQEVQPVVESIGVELRRAAVAHADETGFRVNKRLHWLHTVATSDFTYIHCHPKRGYEAMKAGGVLPTFRGTLIHDCWKPYYLLSCSHALCNAHLLREMTALHEDYGQAWAGKLKTIMLEAFAEVNSKQRSLSSERLKHYQHRASIQIGYGKRDNPEAPKSRKRGRQKNSVAWNFLRRLSKYHDDIWKFAVNPHVGFTNNIAEQAVRMPKVKLKVSGCLRTLEGAQRFCAIRSYLDTMRKQGQNTLEALVRALEGHPIFPTRARAV
jgi:transposase